MGKEEPAVKFCTRHWDDLKLAVENCGLMSLAAENGEQAARNLESEAARGTTIDNFDPLMGAHNAIVARAMNLIKERYRQNPLMVMADADEHPEWACPICALNWCHDEHNRLCTQQGCDWPKEFDWTSEMVNGASDLMLKQWQELGGHRP